jgi:hypothetical protein
MIKYLGPAITSVQAKVLIATAFYTKMLKDEFFFNSLLLALISVNH